MASNNEIKLESGNEPNNQRRNNQPQKQRYRYSNSRNYNDNKKSQANKEQSEDMENTFESSQCVCCLHELRTYVTYSCMHHVCLHCALKMRILCEKLDCPTCRQLSPEVICTKEKIKLEETSDEKRNFTDELKKCIRKHPLGGGFFYSLDVIKIEYEQILNNTCKLCDTRPNFKHFDELELHMKRVHKRFYCELCLKNLKLFSYERKFYNREELAQHRREGDVNDQSFKGHPICDFCDERFFDRDELYRHYRKEHLYCHFCDADGYEEYYHSYDQLRAHFVKYHFLCEIEECSWGTDRANSHEYSVFRTELDFQAHKKQKHAKSKSESKSLGKLNIEFNVKNPIRDRIKTQRHRQQYDGNDEVPTNTRQLRNLYSEFEEAQPRAEAYVEPPPQPIAVTELFIKADEEVVQAQTTWRDLISNGPAPRMNAEAEFPTLGNDGVMHSSLSSLGESITKSNSAWTARKPQQFNEPSNRGKKVAALPQLDKKSSEKNELSGNMINLKQYLKEPEKTVLKIANEEKKEDDVKKNNKKQKKKEINPPSPPPLFNNAEESSRIATKNPPPGFSGIEAQISPDFSKLNLKQVSQSQTPKPPPPPGFQVSPVSPPLTSKPDESYLKPINYEYRNNELMEKLKIFFHTNFDKFKQYSIDYRSNVNLNSKIYFQKCKELMNGDMEKYQKFLNLIQEMIVLLPNITQQNDLFDTYLIELNNFNLNKSSTTALKWVSPINGSSMTNKNDFNNLANCSYCNQILFKDELNMHLNYHRKSDSNNDEFPALSLVVNTNTMSDLPSAYNASIIFNNPNESLSLVNRRKNRFKVKK